MTASNSAKVSVQGTGIAVNLLAELQDDGSVKCSLACNDQDVKIVFTGTDILVDIASD